MCLPNLYSGPWSISHQPRWHHQACAHPLLVHVPSPSLPHHPSRHPPPPPPPTPTFVTAPLNPRLLTMHAAASSPCYRHRHRSHALSAPPMVHQAWCLSSTLPSSLQASHTHCLGFPPSDAISSSLHLDGHCSLVLLAPSSAPVTRHDVLVHLAGLVLGRHCFQF